MRRLVIATIALPFLAIAAVAQVASPPPTSGSQTPTRGTDAPAPIPIPGGSSTIPSSNSIPAAMNQMSEADVRARLAQQGFVNISGFLKGTDGMWRGVAEINSVSTPILVDANGNIQTR